VVSIGFVLKPQQRVQSERNSFMAAEILFRSRPRNWLRFKIVVFKAIFLGFGGRLYEKEDAGDSPFLSTFGRLACI
jgi:hypothetical protein